MRAFTIALAASTLSASVGVAEDASPLKRGMAGAVAVPFVAANAGAQRISCSAAIAHWFSVELGEAAPGRSVEATLWFDPQSGEIAILNEVGDRMPIQTLWCGLAGRSWETRSDVALARRAGDAPGPIRLACSATGDRLGCR